MDTPLGFLLDRQDLLIARVGAHIGARLEQDVTCGVYMRCPACGSAEFGPTMDWRELAVYEDGYLPGAPLLAGACLDCEHITEPKTCWGRYGDPKDDEMLPAGSAAIR